MGVAISVFPLAGLHEEEAEAAELFECELEAIHAALAGEGIEGRIDEPRTVPELELHSEGGFPYSFLHYLRRAFAYQRAGQPIPTGERTEEHEQVVDDESSMFDSHLLCHSDCEGYYVPVPFGEPIFGEDVPGGILGSSHALLEELLEVAPALGIALDAKTKKAPTDDALAALGDVDEEDPLLREKIVWHRLYDCCRVSIDHGTVIYLS